MTSAVPVPPGEEVLTPEGQPGGWPDEVFLHRLSTLAHEVTGTAGGMVTFMEAEVEAATPQTTWWHPGVQLIHQNCLFTFEYKPQIAPIVIKLVF